MRKNKRKQLCEEIIENITLDDIIYLKVRVNTFEDLRYVWVDKPRIAVVRDTGKSYVYSTHLHKWHLIGE